MGCAAYWMTPPSDYYISAHWCYRFSDVWFSSMLPMFDVRCANRPNSTYMRIALYIGIYGILKCTAGRRTFLQTGHVTLERNWPWNVSTMCESLRWRCFRQVFSAAIYIHIHINQSTSSPRAVKISWQHSYISKMTYKTSKLGQYDLVSAHLTMLEASSCYRHLSVCPSVICVNCDKTR